MNQSDILPANGRVPEALRLRTRIIVACGGVLLTLFAILFAIGAIPRFSNQRELAAAVENQRNAVPSVAVIQPAPATAAALTLAATTQAIEDSIIYARTSGYLKKRHVDIGDRVAAGQLLAEIESPETDAQLRQARANLVQAEKQLDLQRANRDLARVTMDRYVAAQTENAVAAEAVDQSVSTYRTAEAAVAAAEAVVESNRATVQQFLELTSFQRVVAPFSGTVLQRNVDVGALITAGSPTDNTAVAPNNLAGAPSGLFEVAQIERLRVFVNVPQAFAPNIRVGMPANVRERGHLDQPLQASVSRTAGSLDPATRTLLAQVDIANSSRQLLPGMFVYVDLQVEPPGTRWRIPSTALIFDAQGTRVATVGGGAIRFRRVEVGRDFGDVIDVQSGLKGDESIVIQPTVALEEGRRVKPIAAQTIR